MSEMLNDILGHNPDRTPGPIKRLIGLPIRLVLWAAWFTTLGFGAVFGANLGRFVAGLILR